MKIRIKLVFYRTLFSQSAASLTMGSLAAYLRKHGFLVDICFMEKEGLHNVEKILENRGDINIVIAKPNFKDFKVLFPILKEIKLQKKIDKIFLCGPFACLNADSLMADLHWLDGIITGQIEETALGVVEKISQKKENIKFFGLVDRGSYGKKLRQLPRKKSVNIDQLPWPDRDLEKREMVNYINIEASRGCNFNCSFCHIPLMQKINNRPGVIESRDPKRVVDEIEHLNKTLGKTLFIFNDSCFWRSKKDNQRMLKFCSEIKKRKLDVHFYIYLRCEPFIESKILKHLAEAGLVRVFLGLENTSSRVQKMFNKSIGRSKYEKINKIFDKYKINVHIGYIVFEPSSTLSEIANNIKYLRKIGKLFRLGVLLEPVRVIPNSAFHLELVKKNLMPKGLKYDEITYGYRFAHPEVGVLFNSLRQMFRVNLKDTTYELEYYCVTAELLKVILERTDHELHKILRKDFSIFNNLKGKTTEIIFNYLIESTGLIKKQKDGDRVNYDNLKNRKFVKQLTESALAVKIKHADIVATIKMCGGEKILKEIYTGLDKI